MLTRGRSKRGAYAPLDSNVIMLAVIHLFHRLYYLHNLSTSKKLHYLFLKSQGGLSCVLTYPSAVL